jgi:ribosome-binding protein aMBF1 (putative translation factor)
MQNTAHIASVIRAELGRRNLTRSWLADQLQMSQQSLLRRMDAGKPLWKHSELEFIARTLDVSLDELTGKTPS